MIKLISTSDVKKIEPGVQISIKSVGEIHDKGLICMRFALRRWVGGRSNARRPLATPSRPPVPIYGLKSFLLLAPPATTSYVHLRCWRRAQFREEQSWVR